MTREEADSVLGKLRAIRNGAESQMRAHWYAPFSGQPEADIGALNIAYSTSVAALERMADSVIAGDTDEARWISLAEEAEKSMRAIQGYTGESSAIAEMDFVASETAKTVASGVQTVVATTARGLWQVIWGILKGAPVLIAIVAISVAILFYRDIRKVTKRL